jgi:NADPH:quinone reductase-like Zn-dependent oxidoreductase
MRDNRGVMGVNMGDMADEAGRIAAWLREVVALWEQGVVRPYIDAAVPFSRAAEAHQMLHDRRNLGKVVLVPDPFFEEGTA